MKNKKSIQRLVGIASLAAMIAVLQVISNYITFGPVSITLALVPLVLGAILYGPLAGGILGVLMGGIILTAPTTVSFLSVNPVVTVFLCLIKTGAAGVVSGFIFKLLYKKNLTLAIILATIAAPITNTGLFALGCICFMMDTLKAWAGDSNAISFLFLTMIGYNFIVEFLVNSILAPTVAYIVRVVSRNYNIGQSFNAGVIYDNDEVNSTEVNNVEEGQE